MTSLWYRDETAMFIFWETICICYLVSRLTFLYCMALAPRLSTWLNLSPGLFFHNPNPDPHPSIISTTESHILTGLSPCCPIKPSEWPQENFLQRRGEYLAPLVWFAWHDSQSKKPIQWQQRQIYGARHHLF